MNIKKLKVVFNSPTAAIPGHVIKEDTDVESPVALVPVGGGSHGVERQVDYAKLLAAAPDLLEALRDCAESMEVLWSVCGKGPNMTLEHAKALIAKLS